MTQKENLMKDCLARKNDPDRPAEKTNKKVQGRETITEPYGRITKTAASFNE